MVRPAAEVEVRSIPAGGAEFITALACGQSLAEATRCGITAESRFDLSTHLAALIGAGVVVGFSLPSGRPGLSST